jgi:hypothetical protein
MFLDIGRLNTIFRKYGGMQYGGMQYGVNNCGMCFGNIQSNNNKTLEW